MIEFKNVSYSYENSENQIRALENINFQVGQGEFVALLGSNGSGKSTLARLINGLLVPNQGEVLVDGLSTSDRESVWEIRSRVGLVFQNPDNQIIANRVEEDVAFGPENLGLSRKEIRSRVAGALEVVEMADYAAFEPHLLSGGQKQRVAIAGALAMRPRYLVFDEATSMLDPRGASEIIATIRRLNQELGITIIFITHIPDEAILANRVLVLSDGKVAMDGIPQEVFMRGDDLQEVGVGVPKAVFFAAELAKAGIDLPRTILTIDELVDVLC